MPCACFIVDSFVRLSRAISLPRASGWEPRHPVLPLCPSCVSPVSPCPSSPFPLPPSPLTQVVGGGRAFLGAPAAVEHSVPLPCMYRFCRVGEGTGDVQTPLDISGRFINFSLVFSH